METIKTLVFRGEVEKDPYGPWSDVDHGFYVNRDKVDIEDILWDYRDMNIKLTVTIEVIEEG